jgi:hypothetical protein
MWCGKPNSCTESPAETDDDDDAVSEEAIEIGGNGMTILVPGSVFI